MKNLLLLHGDLEKTGINHTFAKAYRQGAEKAGAMVKELSIMDLKFLPNKQFNNQITPLEPDLLDAAEKVKWANHIVLFCTVNHDSIPARLSGFFDRLFPSGQSYAGKSARIVSVLDEASWKEWQLNKKPTYHAIKRTVLERCRIMPVRTCTIGYVHSPENDYAKKWIAKMIAFGEKFM
ncbi:NAD(P)H-dependent oxidoreductase [Chitinophaga sp. Cy-1792]|uniref:NAD(P)H-dependent oxidoreductase n=1 Tax=Chitinophaga sp. Cy-1792 TaxID=2608339 RepID=UPI00141FB9F6|nr:NAD(P)H-dependent oxidoreductase [Chitinophaga sp. Cy-1792]NIG57596.1 flavodoxin family protein [Chitinophaga sp. Cy-1792]